MKGKLKDSPVTGWTTNAEEVSLSRLVDVLEESL